MWLVSFTVHFAFLHTPSPPRRSSVAWGSFTSRSSTTESGGSMASTPTWALCRSPTGRPFSSQHRAQVGPLLVPAFPHLSAMLVTETTHPATLYRHPRPNPGRQATRGDGEPGSQSPGRRRQRCDLWGECGGPAAV